MRYGNFVVVRHNGTVVCGKVGDRGIYLKHMGDANPIPVREVEPLFEIEVHQPFPERFKVDDFRKFVIRTLTDADHVKGPHPEITHCEECGCDWLDNGLNPIGCPYCEVRRETERRWEGNRRAAQEYVEDMRNVLKEAAQVCKDLDEEALAKEGRLACGAECAAAIAELAVRMNVPFERT